MSDLIPPVLVFMPEDVMRIILDKCDFISIQRLRNTCHTFRNFIDDTKPNYHIKIFEITDNLQEKRQMTVAFTEKDVNDECYPEGQKIVMNYEKVDEESSKITWCQYNKECIRIINNSNFLDLFSRDVGSILECISPNFDLWVNCERNGSGNIQKVFESCGKTPLKVHSLIISNVMCQEDVMGIIPYTCPDTLKDLQIIESDGSWDISKILQLDHWKKVEKLNMKWISVRAGIQNYEHFDRAEIWFEELRTDDIIRVKDNFLNSPSTTKHLKVCFHSSVEDLLMESFGQPYRDIVGHETWFFRRPDSRVLCMELENYYLLTDIKSLNDLPEGAVLIG